MQLHKYVRYSCNTTDYCTVPQHYEKAVATTPASVFTIRHKEELRIGNQLEQNRTRRS